MNQLQFKLESFEHRSGKVIFSMENCADAPNGQNLLSNYEEIADLVDPTTIALIGKVTSHSKLKP